jgi:arylsulfatase A-like enzyme
MDKISRRDLLKAASLSAASALIPQPQKQYASSSSVRKPNVLIVISDEHRAGLTKRSGYPLDTSPTLDSLANRGVSFDRAYCTEPVCSPSRTSLITGRWPHAHLVRENTNEQQAFFGKDLFDALKSVGYKSGLSGKNNTYLRPEKLDFWREYNDLVGWQPPNPPKEIVEFDDWRRELFFACALAPTPFPLEAQFPYRVVSSAIEFLEKFGSEPFVLEVSFPEPHPPEQVPKPYWDMFPPDEVPSRCVGPEALKQKGFRWQWEYALQNHIYPDSDKIWRRYASNYLGSVKMIDDQLARLLDYMRRSQLLENTIIVYVADHGDYLMDYGLMRKGVGMPEALARIPMVWCGPGIQKEVGNRPVFVSMADVMPTICEAVGVEIPHGVQGRSLWPLLEGKDYPGEEFRSMYVEVGAGGLYYDRSDHVPFSIAELTGATLRHFGKFKVSEKDKTFNELNTVSQCGYMKMVRMGDWKLIYDMMGYGQMYDLASDPCELKNVYGDPSLASIQMQLLEELLMWNIRTQSTLPTGATIPGVGIKIKWPRNHNWYAPYRHGTAPEAFIP